MVCKVLYHDKCFDGACSAAVFTKFHRECISGAERYVYQGLVHRAGSLFDESWFLADGENAIVDFKYSASPRVSWWFDHHQSAFASAEDEARFRTEQQTAKGLQKWFDPSYASCTGLILDVAAERFGLNVQGLKELRKWADVVDGAKYESAQAAVAMKEPAMLLTMVVESASDLEGVSMSQRIIPLLTEMPLVEVLAQPFVQQQLGPLLQRHRENVELIGARAKLAGGVVTFDITDRLTEGYNKFIPYALQPEATYNVGLSKSGFRTKVSVGTNPWTTRPAAELANIAAICERFGGGGHARVGAVSFPVEQEDAARSAAVAIAAELRGAK